MKFIITLIAFFLINVLQAQLSDTPVIFPKPQQLQLKPGTFTISNATVIEINDDAKLTIEFLNNEIQKRYGFRLKLVNKAVSNCIQLGRYSTMQAGIGDAYYLSVSNSSIKIEGIDKQGIFYGVQTLLQLIGNVEVKSKNSKIKTPVSFTIPCLEVSDEPRFAYRGMHLDVCRHFFDVAYIKKYIDYLAAYKFNTFHWHLTDDQGWRIEIKKYPKLTSIGGYRNGTIIGRYPGKGNDGLHYGGFYTQAQIKEVVKYAAERYITIVPEIEMPGHASAAIKAYPQLSCFLMKVQSTRRNVPGPAILPANRCSKPGACLMMYFALASTRSVFCRMYWMRLYNCSHRNIYILVAMNARKRIGNVPLFAAINEGKRFER